jgi:hypothetical protein
MTTIKMCTHANCDAEANCCCECCDTHFCSPEHGSSGGERYPSVCWKCGGGDEE